MKNRFALAKGYSDPSKHQETANSAFDKAIAEGRLSADEASPLFAGNFMFMGFSWDGKTASFKNSNTREYLK